MCFSNMFKQMLVENQIDTIPDWLIKDMGEWLNGKNESLEVLMDMVENYRMDYFKKDRSKYPGATWDKQKNKEVVDKSFVTDVFNNIV